MKAYGLLCLITMALLYYRGRDARWLHLGLVAIIWVPLVGTLARGLVVLTRISTERYDEWFLLSDRFLGSPAFAVGRLLARYPYLHLIALFDYQLYLAAAFGIVVLMFARVGAAQGYRAFLAMLISALASIFFYAVLPASGPRYAFAAFPLVEPIISQPHLLHLWAPPNCLPSNHMSLALLVAAFAWRWKAGRVLGVLHVALTVIATLGLGEHYAVDLIAAVPYAMFCHWSSGLPFRHRVKAAPKVPRARVIGTVEGWVVLDCSLEHLRGLAWIDPSVKLQVVSTECL